MDINTEIEDIVEKGLEKIDIYPYSVTYTSVFSIPLLAITFIAPIDYNSVLELIEYRYKCDRSNYLLIEDTCTIIFTKEAVSLLINKL